MFLHLSSTDLFAICIALRTRLYSLEKDSHCKEFFPEQTSKLIAQLDCLISRLDDFILNKADNSQVILTESLNTKTK